MWRSCERGKELRRRGKGRVGVVYKTKVLLKEEGGGENGGEECKRNNKGGFRGRGWN